MNTINKKICAFTLIFCMLFSLTFSFTPAGTNAVKAEEEVVLTNFAPNGSFEETIKTNRNVWTNNIEPVGWSEWFPSGKPQATVDQTVYYNGKQSILLESVTTGRAALTTTATITPGKSYRLGIWIKTDQVVSSNGIFFTNTICRWLR
jgi:hyaluronate lyase